MLHNLLAEMARKNIKRKEIRALLDISERTLYSKINGNSGFTLAEALLIQKTYFPELSVDYLFEQAE